MASESGVCKPRQHTLLARSMRPAQNMTMATVDTWDPKQYERFRAQRRAPFVDLLAMVERTAGMNVLDLGCGTGELTAELHDKLGARSTHGIDRSPAMLEKSGDRTAKGLSFDRGDIANLSSLSARDLVFSNAALHWVPDHPTLLEKLTDLVRPGGQLAIQIPANHDQPSHTTAAALARDEPFTGALRGFVAPIHVLPPESYAQILHQLGYAEQRVELRVYGHTLERPSQVVEWVKGHDADRLSRTPERCRLRPFRS